METLHATKPLRIGGVMLIPIQRARIESFRKRGRICVLAAAEPTAVVVAEAGRWRAFRLDGAEVALGTLLEEVVGLADAVNERRQ